MAIRINLLAEEQAAEELRRKDPVKRAAWVGGALVALVLAWAGWLQAQVMSSTRQVARAEAEWKKLEKDFNQVTQGLRQTAEVERKLAALDQLSTNRFLWGTLLNAVQQSTVENVRLVRLRSAQTFEVIPATKPQTNDAKVTPGRPATSKEKIVVNLDAKDQGPAPGEQVNKFREALAVLPYFKEQLKKVDGVKLGEFSPVQTDPAEPGRPFVMFTIDCYYPDKIRTK